MGRYDRVRERTGWSPPAGETTRYRDDVTALLALSRDADPRARRVAAKNLCPCHVRAIYPMVWKRLLELARDPDPGVRTDAVHALSDGSPAVFWPSVLSTLTALYNDPDRRVRKQVRRVLAGYRRTGNINVG